MSAPKSAHKTLLVMAGGTGGHIFPALAVADVLRQQGWRVVWLGNPNGMEAKLVPARGYECAWVEFAAVRGKGVMRKLMLPVNLLRACVAARRVIRQVRPDVVLGMGGYITFPGGVMARLAGVPLVIHEQNAVAGLANKVLSHIATRVLTGFPETLPNAIWVGNPVRADIAALADPQQRYGTRAEHEPLHVLIVGGSLGAQALNTALPTAAGQMPVAQRPIIRHQTGPRDQLAVQAAYAAANVDAEVLPFIDDMAAALAWADLVVCRSGALTVAELAAAGVASVLIPFPHAVDDHQRVNAEFLVHGNAGHCVVQKELSTEQLIAFLRQPRAALEAQGIAARALARAEAAITVADICKELAA
ncbi:MAG: undecaprenyldiphospho-muramoylpentapeptide beta-N-acetylglucosaminyltransferase [Rhodocyclaceae bacterium]|nr:undecaprenyldiphospho-muramoylpentapeptide beta-N-acetylglucosaminyltransferase [Rhodocyclaceae bacterium]